MSWLTYLFSGGGKIKEALQRGAVVIDLRTAYEFDQGHIPRSLNIPVDRIKANLGRIKELRKPIIVCCGNGNHCWETAELLREAGIGQVINGGEWHGLLRKMER